MTTDEHDEWLIDIWNNTVGRNDDIWHLGILLLLEMEKLPTLS